MQNILISPSILAANFLKLGEAIEALNRSSCDWIHVDIMDGHFVPEISFGQQIIRAIKEISKKPLDVHLMVKDPLPKIESFVSAGADRLTFHLEAVHDPRQVIDRIHSFGLPAAISIKPETPVVRLLPYLPEVEMVLVMTVEPGFGGQAILPDTIEKIRELREVMLLNHLDLLIEADGGINHENAAILKEAGVNVFVCGSALLHGNIEENITKLRNVL